MVSGQQVSKKKVKGIVLSVNFYNNPHTFEIDILDKNDKVFHAKWPGVKIIKGIFPSEKIIIKGNYSTKNNTFISPDYEID